MGNRKGVRDMRGKIKINMQKKMKLRKIGTDKNGEGKMNWDKG